MDRTQTSARGPHRRPHTLALTSLPIDADRIATLQPAPRHLHLEPHLRHALGWTQRRHRGLAAQPPLSRPSPPASLRSIDTSTPPAHALLACPARSRQDEQIPSAGGKAGVPLPPHCSTAYLHGSMNSSHAPKTASPRRRRMRTRITEALPHHHTALLNRPLARPMPRRRRPRHSSSTRAIRPCPPAKAPRELPAHYNRDRQVALPADRTMAVNRTTDLAVLMLVGPAHPIAAANP